MLGSNQLYRILSKAARLFILTSWINYNTRSGEKNTLFFIFQMLPICFNIITMIIMVTMYLSVYQLQKKPKISIVTAAKAVGKLNNFINLLINAYCRMRQCVCLLRTRAVYVPAMHIRAFYIGIYILTLRVFVCINIY